MTSTTEIKYDTPFEVTKEQYEQLMKQCDGLVAGREEKGKYFIKVWLKGFCLPELKRILKLK